jgi:Zn-dependent metalloprotease
MKLGPWPTAGRRERLSRDRGASFVEWGGALLVIAAVTAVLVSTAGLPSTVSQKTREAICTVFQGENCASGGGQDKGTPEARGPGSPDREIRDGGNNDEVARSEGEGTTGNPAVDQAYDFSGQVYDYFWEQFGRDSYDGRGAPIVISVNDPQTANAAWNPTERRIHFADGWLALDVMGHEFTHAVVQSTAGLEYQGQSGALNESMADIFGSNIDGNWEIGEDTEGGAIRDMADPERFGQPAHVDDYVDTPEDNGGVHTNSGIPNHAYYLMAEAIGRDKAGQIVYRALTEHLEPDSGFEDFRTASLQVAGDRYGEDSPEYRAVNEAFAKVGLDGSWEAP